MAYIQWVLDHWATTIVPVLLFVVNGLINALTKYPTAVTWLHRLSDFFAWTTHQDSPGTLKLPGQSSAPPSA